MPSPPGTHPPSPAACLPLKVADFGLARVIAANCSVIKTHTFGTVTHMPPELLAKGAAWLRLALVLEKRGNLVYFLLCPHACPYIPPFCDGLHE